MIGDDENAAVVDQRRGAVALVDGVIADAGLPEDRAVGIEGGAEHCIRVGKGDEEAVTFGGNGRRGAGRFFILPHCPFRMHLPLPDQLAGGPLEREHRLAAGRFVAGGEIDPVPHHRRRAVPPAGNIDRPDDVRRIAPRLRHALPGRSLAIVGRATPAGPVVCGWRGGGESHPPDRHQEQTAGETEAGRRRRPAGQEGRAGVGQRRAPEGPTGVTAMADAADHTTPDRAILTPPRRPRSGQRAGHPGRGAASASRRRGSGRGGDGRASRRTR